MIGSEGSGMQRSANDRYGASRQAPINPRVNGAGASRSSFASGQQTARPQQQSQHDGASHSQERRASNAGTDESSFGNDGFPDFDDVSGFV